MEDFPGGSVVKNSPANAGDVGLILGPGQSHNPQSSEAHGPQTMKLLLWSPGAATILSPHAANTDAQVP